jgi:hypothetical protein
MFIWEKCVALNGNSIANIDKEGYEIYFFNIPAPKEYLQYWLKI